MSISIALPFSLDIHSYTGLIEFLTSHLELSDDTVAQLPTLIRLAEVRLDRIIPDASKEKSDTIVTVAAAQASPLPSDFEALQQVRMMGTGGHPLAQVHIDQLEDYDSAGKPVMFAIHSNALQFAPVPDGAYTLAIRYRAKLTPLTDAAPSNWLLESNADAYVYMSAAVICQHDGDIERASIYLGMADAVVGEINKRSVRMKFGGNLSPRLVCVP